MILNIAMIAVMIGSQPQFNAFLDQTARNTASKCTTDLSINYFSVNYNDSQDVYRVIKSQLPTGRKVKDFSCAVYYCSYDTHNVTCYFNF